MGRSSRATALLAAAAGCGVLSGVDAFAPSVTGLALRGGRVNVASRGVCGARGVGMMAKSDRDDGATDEEIREAYDVYNNLMGTMNNGRGYWMDEPMQFFENIKTAVDRNFGKGKGLEGINLPEMGSDAAPVKAKDLKSSPFKPLVNTGETIETEPQTKPAEAVTPVAEKPAVEEEENDEDLAELQAKMASSDAAKKKAEADAAALKAKLMED